MTVQDKRVAAAPSAFVKSALGKSSVISITDIISEGPIHGIVGGTAGVFLDNVSMSDPFDGGSSISHGGSAGDHQITFTAGSNKANIINASTDFLKTLYTAPKGRHGAAENANKRAMVLAGLGKMTVTATPYVYTVTQGETQEMTLTKQSGDSFNADMVDPSHRGGTSSDKVIPVRFIPQAGTGYETIYASIVSYTNASTVKIVMGYPGSNPINALPAGTYDIEIDKEIVLKKSTTTNPNQLTTGGLHRFKVKGHKKKDNGKWGMSDQWFVQYDEQLRGFGHFGPPFLNNYYSGSEHPPTFDVDDSINFDYPASGNQRFHWLWFGYFKPTVTGKYSFKLSSDDGSGMWIGRAATASHEENLESNIRTQHTALVNAKLGKGSAMKNNMDNVGTTEVLTAGVAYPIRIVYINNKDKGAIRFEWKRDATGESYSTDLSSNFLRYTDPSTGKMAYTDLTNIELAENWDGDTGTYGMDLLESEIENIGQQDQRNTQVSGGSVGFRAGHFNQAPLPSFTAEGGGTGVALTHSPQVPVKLEKDAGDTILQGNSEAGFNLTPEQITSIDRVIVNIDYPQGLYQMHEGSDRGAVAVYKVRAQFKNVGSNDFETQKHVIIEELYHRTNNSSDKGDRGIKDALTFNHTFDLTKFKPFSDFKIIIERLTESVGTGYNPGGENWKKGVNGDYDIFATSTIGSVTSIIEDNLSYPYTAYANVTYNTRDFQNLPKRTYHCKGLKVQVPSNYVTRDEAGDGVAKYTRNSSGTVTNTYQDWDGTFRDELIYTNNPAWIFRDALVNNRYGLGEFISADDIDKYALYRIARYCDDMVDDGKGGSEPRFTLNTYFTKAADAYKVLKDLCTNFTSMLYWFDSSIVPVIDQPKDPIYNFTAGNVINGEFNYETTGSKTRANQIYVSWNNPNNNYKLESLLVEDKQNILKTGRLITENVQAFGCTSEGQATRYGLWKLWTAANQTELVSFETSMAAKFLIPGDIINIQDANRTRTKYSGRVSSGTGASSVKLDRDVTLKSGYTYRLHVLIESPAALLAENETTTINLGGTNNRDYNPGDFVERAWVYSEEDEEYILDDIDTEEKAANAKAAANASDALNLAWSNYTRVESRTIQSTGTTDTLQVDSSETSFSSAPNTETVWVLEEVENTESIISDASAKQYKILALEEKDDKTFAVTAVEFSNRKFKDIESLDFVNTAENLKLEEEDNKSFVQPIRGLALSLDN